MGRRSVGSQRGALGDLDDDALDERAARDARGLERVLRGARRLERDLAATPALWERDDEEPLSPDERDVARRHLVRLLDHQIALDGLRARNLDFWGLVRIADPLRAARHFVLGFAADTTALALGYSFLERAQGRAQFEVLLDEGSPRHGLSAGDFAALKATILDPSRGPLVVAARQYDKHVARAHYGDLARDGRLATAVAAIDEGYPAVKRRLLLDAPLLFVEHALDWLRDSAHGAYFPIQATVAEWLGDTKVHRVGSSLIAPAQIERASRAAQPGDIVLERRNWYLSNLGLPGFWPHMALWLGTAGELAGFLDDDPAVRSHYRGRFTEALARRHGAAWAAFTAPDSAGKAPRLIEAVSEGVLFTTAEHSLDADYAAALRPGRSRLEIARAIERAFEQHGLPYDFDFDAYSDSAVVCSELVQKAFEPRAGVEGLRLPLVRMAGRMTLPPNEVVRLFDLELGTPEQQLAFGWFLDGSEATGQAEFADEAALRASHRRPKWDLAQK